MFNHNRPIDISDIPKKEILLNTFAYGIIDVYKHIPNKNWPELVAQIQFNDTSEKTLMLDHNFMGMFIGESLDQTKKWEILFIGYPEDVTKNYLSILESKNKKS